MAGVTQDAVVAALRTVQDPELHQDLISLGMVRGVSIDGPCVRVHVELTTPACPVRETIARDIQTALRQVAGVEDVQVEFSARARPGVVPEGELPLVGSVLAVGAGKGGVGKSTAAVMLATGLRRRGRAVGLLDADVYGPSIPTLLGIAGRKPSVRDHRMVPIDAGGLKVMSIGFLVDPTQPMILRGPVIHGVVKQFLEQVEWGVLDYLIVDLPPGTGDVPLTLAQSIPVTGAVVICTPQDVALHDARRAIRMYQHLNVECLGIIENMSYYLCPKCGHRDEPFNHGGAARAARELQVPFLGEIPLNAQVRVLGDEGAPEKLFTDTPDYVRVAIEAVVANVEEQVELRQHAESDAPKLTIE
ncbi:MAG TPA: Mrp/NBP35 family ATP-binding protein [Phycisphaerae bacterium]|nr:Mrp/NBP35 family ATP-binding protein [Phycisphaerae bacterium]HNU44594.1 Mrp/NBP35 family ATP-binding protein [Phycisphaerae bacterium]